MLDIAIWSLDTAVSPADLDGRRYFGAGDERRANVQAYRYWIARAAGRRMPSLLDCADLETAPFAARAAVVRLAVDGDEMEICSIGTGLDAELAPPGGPIRELFVELLERLPLVTVQGVPVGFEADLPGIASIDRDFAYRGILLPLGENENVISHVLAVLNWRRGGWRDAEPLPDDMR